MSPDITEALANLYSRKTLLVMAYSDGHLSNSPPPEPVVVLPGSFNPLHTGHRRLLKAASKATGRRGIFEISIENVDKPDLPVDELTKRLEQFRGVGDVAVTSAPLFSGKADALPGAWFALGFDTAVRLLEDKYYEDDGTPGSPAENAMKRLAERGVKFVVAGREDGSGTFRKASELKTPPSLRDMFTAIPEDEFRADISSTELRRQRGS